MINTNTNYIGFVSFSVTKEESKSKGGRWKVITNSQLLPVERIPSPLGSLILQLTDRPIEQSLTRYLCLSMTWGFSPKTIPRLSSPRSSCVLRPPPPCLLFLFPVEKQQEYETGVRKTPGV